MFSYPKNENNTEKNLEDIIMRQTKKKKSGVILIVLVVAILAAIAGIAWYLYNKNNAQEEAAGHYIEQKVEKIEYTDIAKAKAGDTVAFGKYDDEKIAWKVLEKKDNELILLSDHCIAKHAYHDKNKAVTWENCALRKWLNEFFYQKTFSDKEKAQIIKTKVVNEDNDAFDTYETLNRVFPISFSWDMRSET